MIRIVFAPDLVEEAVLLAERTIMRDPNAFRRERDRIYQVADESEREKKFRALHFRYFSALGLDSAVRVTLAEHGEVTAGIDSCHVVRALTQNDETADLVDELHPRQGADVLPALVIRMRPASVVKAVDVVQTFLHHELMHVADMLNSAFGYVRYLPPSDDGPSADTMRQNRYRVLWDTTIDGRLARSGLAHADARDTRWREFACTFAMLGDQCSVAFERWFNDVNPTHEGILAFAMSPLGRVDRTDPGRCPLCRFPTASLDPRITSLSDAVIDTIRSERPEWHRDHGICPQCLDLYLARHVDAREHHAAADKARS
jgi:hypothetical protein